MVNDKLVRRSQMAHLFSCKYSQLMKRGYSADPWRTVILEVAGGGHSESGKGHAEPPQPHWPLGRLLP